MSAAGGLLSLLWAIFPTKADPLILAVLVVVAIVGAMKRGKR